METNNNPQAAALALGLDKKNHKALTLKQAKELPVQHSGHADNMLYKSRDLEVRISRMTTRDGARYNNAVTVSVYDNKTGGMKDVRTYQAK